MGIQRNMSNMKEQNKAPENELNKMKTNNPAYVQFKTLVLRMINELRGRGDELSENFNKEIEIKNGYENHKREPVRNEYNI